ncbi:MAG: arsenosugar biosynthesis radical SAM protein ArsS [Crocinitomicaceae bacterium]|nr:arsenosugar biosynthesis radical SAM protein ArsS [Crocinitomicaceae bacterium]
MISTKKSFQEVLKEHHYELKTNRPEIFQINLGYLCNQQCKHCHVDASPYRKEIMNKETLNTCLQKIDELQVQTVDLTGGAPEMNPNFLWLLDELAKRDLEIIIRSNLTILVEGKFKSYPEIFKQKKVRIISSLPCYTQENVDKQRGKGVYDKSISALKKLNELGYGKDKNLILDLVYNPGGASIAPDQSALELDYKKRLQEDFDIKFNQLFCITNLPIARFLDDLEKAGKALEYQQKLIDAFNPATLNNLMCRNTISVSYDGKVYDCDFNQMLKLPSKGIQKIEDINAENILQRTVLTGNHCFGCTAGGGSSCQGALT